MNKFGVREYIAANGGNPEDVKQRIAAKAELDRRVKARKLTKVKNGREVVFIEESIIDLTEICIAASKRPNFSGFQVEYVYEGRTTIHSRRFSVENEHFMHEFIANFKSAGCGTIVKYGRYENGVYLD